MKKILLLFITSLLLLSCSENENVKEVSVSNEDLIGTWNVTAMSNYSYVKTVTKNNSGQSISSETKTESYGKDFDFKYTFSKSPNKVTSSGSYTAVIKTTFEGKTSTMEHKAESVNGLTNGIWTKNGDIITITANGLAQNAKIESFENNTMKIKVSMKKSLTLKDSSNDVEIELNLTMKKQ